MSYYDIKRKKLGLQLRDPTKDYDIHPIHAAAGVGDVDTLMRCWDEEDSSVTFHDKRGQNVFMILSRFGHLEGVPTSQP